MASTSLITTAGMLFLISIIIYAVVQICAFYDISSSTYGIYLGFYMFLIASCFILPTQIPEV